VNHDVLALTQTSLSVKQLEQQILIRQIASFQPGAQWVSTVDFSTQLNQATSSYQASRTAWVTMSELQGHQVWQYKELSLDELVTQSSLLTGQFNKLTEGLNRQLGLMAVVLNGGKGR
jgi:hypothetical protein